MTTRAKGTFDVKLTPQTDDEKSGEATLGRLSIDKQFHGDIEAVSKGQMLTAGTAVQGSAGYVAIERVSGALHGRSGTFVLQHSGIMTRGTPQLTITVVPDSGTGQLTGLTGKMEILMTDPIQGTLHGRLHVRPPSDVRVPLFEPTLLPKLESSREDTEGANLRFKDQKLAAMVAFPRRR